MYHPSNQQTTPSTLPAKLPHTAMSATLQSAVLRGGSSAPVQISPCRWADGVARLWNTRADAQPHSEAGV